MQQDLYYKSQWNESISYGIAVDRVIIDENGRMWVCNDEYSTQVNYCPFTGTPAPVQMRVKEEVSVRGIAFKVFEETHNTQ